MAVDFDFAAYESGNATRALDGFGIDLPADAEHWVNRLNDLRITRRHRNRTHAGRFGLAQHPDDHRQPFDVREGLPRQACGGHTRRN